MKSRLTDSVETALGAADGLVVVDAGGKRDLLFSRHLACPDCGISVPELAPRMFSFNSPYGACPECDGLGVKKSFAPERIIADETKSLRAGALRWGDANWLQVLESGLFRAYKVRPTTTYAKLPARFKKILWEGAGNREFAFKWKGQRLSYEYRKRWQGILAILDKRYRDTASDARRQELEKLMATRPCPACKGARLRPESLSVKVGGETIAAHAGMSVARAAEFHAKLRLQKTERTIATPILKEIVERLRFLENVGARLPDARSRGDHVVRRRGAAYPAGDADWLALDGRAVHPGRAVDRAAPARQPQAARHARGHARPRQHRRRRRARRGDDSQRGLRRRPGPGRRRARRRGRRRRERRARSNAPGSR